MGRPKLLLEVAGRPIIRHAVERVISSGIRQVLVVAPPEHEALARALDGLEVRFAVNPTPEAGQGSSVIAGVRALAAGPRPFSSRSATSRASRRRSYRPFSKR